MKSDYLIVGAGLFGAVCARILSDAGYRCFVIEKRNHVGGNCHTESWDGITIHKYGPHIFHTDDQQAWDFANHYADFMPFTLQVVAKSGDKMYNLPFNMWTFHQLYGSTTPEQARKDIEAHCDFSGDAVTIEQAALKKIGRPAYELLVKPYTEKQWGMPASELPRQIIDRLPVRFTYDNNYFNDRYQGIPKHGYTAMIENMLTGVEVRFGVDFVADKEFWQSRALQVIYTGPIDRYFDYKLGSLDYKSVSHTHTMMETTNYQGAPVVNLLDHPHYTRCIEHKHFAKEIMDDPVTWVSHERPITYIPDKTEAMYPVNDHRNNELYKRYVEMTKYMTNVHFGGRLGSYKYYDMDDTIINAMKLSVELLKRV